MKTIRRAMVRAIPTCTMWTYDERSMSYRFRLWPSFVVPDTELAWAELV